MEETRYNQIRRIFRSFNFDTVPNFILLPAHFTESDILRSDVSPLLPILVLQTRKSYGIAKVPFYACQTQTPIDLAKKLYPCTTPYQISPLEERNRKISQSREKAQGPIKSLILSEASIGCKPFP